MKKNLRKYSTKLVHSELKAYGGYRRMQWNSGVRQVKATS